MIVRISSIAIPSTKVTDYLEHVRRYWIPRYNRAAGLESLSLLQRELIAYVEVITITVWDSEDALNRFFQDWPLDDTKCEYAGIEFEPATYSLLMFRRNPQRDHGLG